MILGASAEEKAELRLSDPSRYRYLGGSAAGSPGSVSGASGDNEQFEYARLMQSMEMVGFSRDKMSKSTRVLSAVLHLGNLDFSRRWAMTFQIGHFLLITEDKFACITYLVKWY